ncbi:D-alanine--D-alanine ligase [Winkia sp. ACRQY]|uniref:D-alanine--D-alanine ligase n=2 Tax=Winkia neuii TaxID=33007 RepID=K0YNX3_9ACTO|nr:MULTISPECIES: D-alanine--D-alanine ligase [Winkia]OFT40163.1 D-alanine--D-alanine ligase [Actinomyces sp. HMSC08A01]EJZ85141.1 D-alanine-D-alanine ligase [Winkia neuii BV029A5]MCG7302671.1 D-alanine--D-alanine ligase [Winkia sp. ACRQY]MDK6241543.1 D-alanine--D-alanine ligase [Winkia sp. UMB10116]MDK7163085.1 D-alanine--D-alanine ligase [Winkia sp. UMB3105]
MANEEQAPMPQELPRSVAVVAGGITQERDVSLASGTRVTNRLVRAGFDAHLVEFGPHLLENLNRMQPDVVFPLVHGSFGEDGTLQALLKLAGFPFVGSGPQACKLSSAKPVAKSVVAKNGLTTPPAVSLPQEVFRQLDSDQILDLLENKLGLPMMVKPASGGSALGVTYVNDRADLARAMISAFSYDEEVLVEQYVSGRELAVSIIDSEDGPVALPVVEIMPEDGRYDYDARYEVGRSAFSVPAELDQKALEAVHDLALGCHRVLELSHLSRIDVILDEQGTPWFIDANVAPGMTDTSLFPQAAEAAEGSSFQQILQDLVIRAYQQGSREVTDVAD